jgi:2,4-dienoyl-CoA reductase-like NADH-dependent reductase (Old Yellow Enzyme family)
MILRQIEKYLQAQGMTPTAFGRAAAGDPRLVFDLRRGREPGPRMCARIEAFMGGRR